MQNANETLARSSQKQKRITLVLINSSESAKAAETIRNAKWFLDSFDLISSREKHYNCFRQESKRRKNRNIMLNTIQIIHSLIGRSEWKSRKTRLSQLNDRFALD